MQEHRIPIVVRYSETDQMGIVYHAHSLVWFELARTALLEAAGFRYADLEQGGLLLPVLGVEAQYKRPVRYGDPVQAVARVDSYSGVRLAFRYTIYGIENSLCVVGRTEHAIVGKKDFRPQILRHTQPALDAFFRSAAH